MIKLKTILTIKSRTILVAILISSYFFSNAQTYCYPIFSGTGTQIISNVNVGGMTSYTPSNIGWNYTNRIANISAGDTIPFNVVTGGISGIAGIALFVDLNDDGDFADTNELLYNKYLSSTPTKTMTVPALATPGQHRFRVIVTDNVAPGSNACGYISATGQFQDYTLNISNGCPSDSNLTVSNITSTSADFSWAPRNVIGYEYNLDTSASRPTGLGIPTTSTGFSANGLINGHRYYFHMRNNCGNGIYSAWGRVDFMACNLPDAQINLSGNVKLCRGDNLTLSVPLDTNYTYQWYMNGIKLNGKTNSFVDVTLISGNYYVVITAFPGCKSTSNEANVSIHDKPKTPPILSVNHVTLTTGGFATYEWYLNGNIISGNIDSTHVASVNGKYVVIGYDSNGCFSSSNSVDVVGVGLRTYNNVLGVKIFPNPVNDILHFTHVIDVYIENVQLRDQIGMLVCSVNAGKQFNNLDVSNLEEGVYFLHILYDNGQRSVHRFLKVNQ